MTQKLNIIFIADSLHGGGSERVLLNAANMFQQAGHHCHILLVRNIIEMTLPENVQLHTFKLTERLRPKFIQEFCIRNKVKQLRKQLGNIDLILSNFTSPRFFLPRQLEKTTYYWLHFDYKNSLENKKKQSVQAFLKFKNKLQKKHTNKNIICVSKGAQDTLLNDIQAKPKSSQVIYNPFDIEQIRKLAQESNSNIPNTPYILHPARFDIAQKRHDVLFQAFSQLNTEHTLVLLTKENDELTALIKQYHLSDRVIVTGFQRNPYPWFKQSELTVLSSDWEGLPSVIIESLAIGTPVVSTDCPSGPKEILTNELSQWLTPIRDPEQLVQKIIQALTSNIKIKPSSTHPFSTKTILIQYLSLLERSQHKTNA
ncbi:glycosyltransferase [Piscirickettsia salmonis]|uniref:glycosyltransferase n=1 Tax=Piscirickettsia salmonis TaxID=1238 RepID=UPI0002D8F3C0|nr:glycosyltransferase [Piscirickettsia salmonis]APS57980.1 glycosyltransferase [Piscirickettsia salmonis]ERL62202.1 glycosyl transferases group 1 family protein [Piscirickettsia salmonis LF-89 = ATCC VR-1361]PEQ17767.1 glycosyltransferase [Piscirickettsia salmonis]QGN76292.1 Glycosyltransferase involved in cell wall bisynthesis [Piscirickettsia salmonis]QGN79855.1 Glycosyltransferase involved in cell wall bisynthesis [Piscirickettsia salmonis]